MELKGKVALITGGTAGIGKATAKLYLENEVKVAIAGRNEKRGQSTLQDLRKVSEDVIFIQGDVSN
ncbi:MAG: SDR family NAD(P)-dependent oxidoreductase, partial [Candidatus Helarchaeota archaeon]